MNKSIFNTAFVRAVCSVIGFILVILTSKFFGAEGRGIISLLTLNVTLVMMANNFVGGSAIVYLIPRGNTKSIIIVSFLWSLLICLIIPFIIYFLNQVSYEMLPWLFTIGLFQAMFTTFQNVLLAKEKLKEYNIVTFLQSALFLLFFVFTYFCFEKNITAYFIAFAGCYFLTAVFSLMLNYKLFFEIKGNFEMSVLRSCLQLGFLVQLANLIQFFNYRLSFYLLKEFTAIKILGIYSTAILFTDTILIFAKSVSVVQYAKIANTDNKSYSLRITIKNTRLTVLVTSILMLIIAMLPNQIFSMMLGDEFLELKTIILLSAPATILFSGGAVIAHYFSGIGNYRINTYTAAIGFAFTISLGYILIPLYGMYGAIAAMSLSYAANTIYLIYHFKKESDLHILELIPGKSDVLELIGTVRKIVRL